MVEQAKKRVVYVVSENLVKISSLLPSNKNRSYFVHSLINQLGLLAKNDNISLRVIPPRPATESELLAYHDSEYISFVLNSDNSGRRAGSDNEHEFINFGIEDDCPPFKGLPGYIQLIAGATLIAARSIIQGTADIAICWDGGRHHAEKSRASGFCYVADCVLAILLLKRPVTPSQSILNCTSSQSQRKPRIMYLDLDLHFCDAVSQAFSNRNGVASQVLIVSIHHASPGFFPASTMANLSDPDSPDFDPFNLSIPLNIGTSSKSIECIWQNAIEPIRNAFEPDVVVIQCGTDGLAADPCAIWNWRTGLESGDMGWCIEQILKNWKCKLLLLGGGMSINSAFVPKLIRWHWYTTGGYNSPNAARAWAHLTSIAIGNPLPLDTQIPDHSLFPHYAPSFTLDVPEGNMRDENTKAYLSEVGRRFGIVAYTIKERMSIALI